MGEKRGMLQAYRLLHVVLRDATHTGWFEGVTILDRARIPRSFAEDSGFSRRIYFYPENWACCTSNGLDPQQMEAGIAPLTSIVTACKDSRRRHFILCLSPSPPLPSLFLFTHIAEHSPCHKSMLSDPFLKQNASCTPQRARHCLQGGETGIWTPGTPH